MAQHVEVQPTARQGSIGTAVGDVGGQHRFAEINGLRLHYVEAGAGPLVVLLHGFPELWYGWRHQISALAAAGFRVVAPDMRGYNLSDKPRPISAYTVRTLALDVHGLIASLGCTRASLVGHDWGAGVAWAFAMQHPEVLTRLCVLNGPHPLRLLKGMQNPRQLLRSWYMFFFQLPWLPEHLLRRDHHALLISAFDELPVEARFTPAELEVYRSAFEQPDALRGMLNYYRAMLRPGGAVQPARIEAEVLVLWGEKDPHLGRGLAEPSPLWVPRARVEYFPEVGHFIQHERPQQVNERLIAFLDGSRESAAAPV